MTIRDGSKQIVLPMELIDEIDLYFEMSPGRKKNNREKFEHIWNSFKGQNFTALFSLEMARPRHLALANVGEEAGAIIRGITLSIQRANNTQDRKAMREILQELVDQIEATNGKLWEVRAREEGLQKEEEVDVQDLEELKEELLEERLDLVIEDEHEPKEKST